MLALNTVFSGACIGRQTADGPRLQRLIADLEDPDKAKRINAIDEITSLRYKQNIARAIPKNGLQMSAADSRPTVSNAAAEALKKIASAGRD